MLHVHGIPVSVYEADASAAARTQGGQIDIHEQDGQVALEAARLSAEFKSIIHQGGEASRILDAQGNVLLEELDNGTGSRPEVLRGDLRRILIDSLPPEAVHWGKKLASASPLGGGHFRLSFADGSTVTTDLLVGADGAWSRVRPLLSDETPRYVGVSYVETYLYDSDRKHPAAAAMVGGGSMAALLPGKGVTAHREANGVIHTYVQLRRPAEWFAAIDFDKPDDAKATVAAEFAGWAPEITALITEADAPPVLRPIHTLSTGHRWDPVPGVTLVGDAAHLSPPGGSGANVAMLDGAELAQAIVAYPGDVDAALADYEGPMFVRGEQTAVGGYQILDLLLGDSAPMGFVRFLSGIPTA